LEGKQLGTIKMSEINIVNLIDNRIKQELSEFEVKKNNEIKNTS